MLNLQEENQRTVSIFRYLQNELHDFGADISRRITYRIVADIQFNIVEVSHHILSQSFCFLELSVQCAQLWYMTIDHMRMPEVNSIHELKHNKKMCALFFQAPLA
jgi:hypothetical protein